MKEDFDPRKSVVLQMRNKPTPSPDYYGLKTQEQYLNMTYKRPYQQIPTKLSQNIPKIYSKKDPGFKERSHQDQEVRDYFRFSQANKSHDFSKTRSRDDISYLKEASEYAKQEEQKRLKKVQE